MAKHVEEAMLPGEDGKVNKASLWEGTFSAYFAYFAYCVYNIIFFFRKGR
jgi:hypothetical protein